MRQRGSEMVAPLAVSDVMSQGASGRFVVRIPRGLHAELARQARVEGVSLNQYVATLLAGAAGWRGAARRPHGGGCPGACPTTGRGVAPTTSARHRPQG